MRLALVALTASLVLAGCGEKQATGNTNAFDEAVTAEDFAANDATAIDAATGADANMAADVEFNLDESNSGEASTGLAERGFEDRRRPAPPANDSGSEPEPEPAETAEPGADASGNSN